MIKVREKFFLRSFLFYFYYFSFLHHLPHFNLFLRDDKDGTGEIPYNRKNPLLNGTTKR